MVQLKIWQVIVPYGYGIHAVRAKKAEMGISNPQCPLTLPWWAVTLISFLISSREQVNYVMALSCPETILPSPTFLISLM